MKKAPQFEAKFAVFLTAFTEGADVRDALKTAGLRYSEISARQQIDQTVAERFKQARLARETWYRMVRSDEMHRRAVEGVEEPMVSAGKKVACRRSYSDNLLLNLCRADDPERFVERTKSELTLTGNPWADMLVHIEKGRAAAKTE